MQTRLTMLASGAALALLGAGPAAALSPETTCESITLHAAGHYARCVARAARLANARARELSDADVAACDARFDHAIARAEAGGACSTPGAPATLRTPIRRQMEDTLATVQDAGACPTAIIVDEANKTYTCKINGGGKYSIDLAKIVEQIGSSDVTTGSVVWIEGWGGHGGSGNTGNGGGGGFGGYAQMTTTPVDLESEFSSTVVYYYNGNNGGGGVNTGGGGGAAATMVTMNDMTQSSPDIGSTLIIAPGAGGGGGGRGKLDSCSDKYVWGADGGGGGVAISAKGTDKYAKGGDGLDYRSQDNSGGGGGGNADGLGGTIGGGNAQSGDDGIAPIGGGSTGFKNVAGTSVSASGGEGGEPGDGAGGGNGGGGYGAGGGGEEGTSHDDCTSGGGGGGGAFARASTQTCTRSQPSRDEGAVQFVFDAGNCSSSGGGGGAGTPVVQAVSPDSVSVGQTFKITGSGFEQPSNATGVLIGSQTLETTAWTITSDSEIDVQAPADPVQFGTPLLVQVENTKGKSGDILNVTINAGAPTVESVSMSTVTVGEPFTINGTNFIDPTEVDIGGGPIDPSTWSADSEGNTIDVKAAPDVGSSLYGQALAVEVKTKYGDSGSGVTVTIEPQ